MPSALFPVYTILMLETLRALDTLLFRLINNLPHNIVINSFFVFFSGIGWWGMVWLIIWFAVILYKFGEEIVEDTSLFLSGLITFLFVSLGLKNFIHRPRPEFRIFNAKVIIDTSLTWSFPSTHATLAFAAAYILSKGHKRWQAVFYLCAFLIAFSRVYLGKHYPSDVIVGGIVGTVIGMSSHQISKMIFKSHK